MHLQLASLVAYFTYMAIYTSCIPKCRINHSSNWGKLEIGVQRRKKVKLIVHFQTIAVFLWIEMSLSAIGLCNYRVNGPQETRALQVLSTRWSEIRKKKLSPPPSTSLFPQVIPSSKNPNIIRYTRHPDGVSEQNFFSPLPKKERSFLPSFVSESPASNTCLSVVSFLLSNCSSFRSHLLKKKAFGHCSLPGSFSLKRGNTGNCRKKPHQQSLFVLHWTQKRTAIILCTTRVLRWATKITKRAPKSPFSVEK